MTDVKNKQDTLIDFFNNFFGIATLFVVFSGIPQIINLSKYDALYFFDVNRIWIDFYFISVNWIVIFVLLFVLFFLIKIKRKKLLKINIIHITIFSFLLGLILYVSCFNKQKPREVMIKGETGTNHFIQYQTSDFAFINSGGDSKVYPIQMEKVIFQNK